MMMRTSFEFCLSSFVRYAALGTIGLWLVTISGCGGAAAPALSAAGSAAMTATQGVAVANAKEKEPELDKDEDKSSKCEQLARNPPGVEEIRRTPDLEIESRELRIERSADSYRWVVHRVLGSSPAGWHKQIALDKLHFSPPLQYLLPDKDPKFLAYVASAPQTPAESEQTISVADDFGQRVGNFDWRERQYTYTISKVLPCFPEPEE